MDKHHEIWDDGFDIYILTGGHKVPLKDAPPSLLKIFKMEMKKDAQVAEKLFMMGNITKAQQLAQFLKCRYGNFDNEPDFTHAGESTHEYIDCPKRGNCPGEGVVCKHLKVQNGYLTNREIDVIKFITLDLPDKQLCHLLHISANTLKNHKAHIMEKTGYHSQVGIAMFAVKHVLA
jgi:DNA-binding CsgD family transcriptional regulator